MDMEELYLFVESQSTTATGDAVINTVVTSKSNDNDLLMGTPNAQTFSSSSSTPAIPAALVAVGNAEETSVNSDNGPCSNDNPDYAEDTQPCPGAIIFDGIVTTVAPGGDDTFSNEFDTETEPTTTETLTGGETTAELLGPDGDVASNDIGATTVAPGSDLTTTLPDGDAANNDSIVDGDIGATTVAPGSDLTTTLPDDDAANTVETVDSDTGATTVAPGSDLTSTLPDDDVANTVETVDGDTGTGTTTATADDTTVVTSNVDGDSAFYSCNAATEDELINSTKSNEAIPISFNYEIYTPTNVDDVTSVLSTFERQLANGVASSLGLVDCPELAVEVAMRSVGGGRHLMPTRRTLQKGGGNRVLEDSMVVGVSMDPEDKLSDTNNLSEECTSSVALDTPSECSLIYGAMTAWITSAEQQRLRQLVDTDSKEEQEAILLTTVQSYIEQNQDSYLNDDLLHVVYIGQRDLTVDVKVPEPISETEQVDMNPSQNAGMNAGFIGLTVVAVLFALVSVGVAWTYRRRQRRRNQVDEHGLDLEQGAFPGLTPESASYRFSEAGDTQGALPPPDEEAAYNNIFGLSGPTSDDAAAEDPSAGAAEDPNGGAVPEVVSVSISSTDSHLSYSPGASPLARNNGQYVAEDSVSFDATPNAQDSLSFDIAPLSPMTASEDNSDISVDSSVFEGANEDKVVPAPVTSPLESTDDATNDSAMLDLDDTAPMMPEEEADYDSGDDAEQSGLLV